MSNAIQHTFKTALTLAPILTKLLPLAMDAFQTKQRLNHDEQLAFNDNISKLLQHQDKAVQSMALSTFQMADLNMDDAMVEAFRVLLSNNATPEAALKVCNEIHQQQVALKKSALVLDVVKTVLTSVTLALVPILVASLMKDRR